jgi:hypothetical protein
MSVGESFAVLLHMFWRKIFEILIELDNVGREILYTIGCRGLVVVRENLVEFMTSEIPRA